MFSFKSTWTVLHDLLVLGSFILEPYLHLDIDRERQEGMIRNDNISIWMLDRKKR